MSESEMDQVETSENDEQPTEASFGKQSMLKQRMLQIINWTALSNQVSYPDIKKTVLCALNLCSPLNSKHTSAGMRI